METTLTAIANKTGGRYFRARDADELAKIYALLDDELAASDEWGFRPVATGRSARRSCSRLRRRSAWSPRAGRRAARRPSRCGAMSAMGLFISCGSAARAAARRDLVDLQLRVPRRRLARLRRSPRPKCYAKPLAADRSRGASGVLALARGPNVERSSFPRSRSEALVVALASRLDAVTSSVAHRARAPQGALSILLERRTAETRSSASRCMCSRSRRDTRTILSSLVGAVNTLIMRTQGSSSASGLSKSASLLRQTGLRTGNPCDLTHADAGPADVDLAGRFNAACSRSAPSRARIPLG